MKKLWQFLNTPIIVALISIGLVFGLTFMSLFRVFSLFDQDEKQRNQIEALGRLQLISFSESDTPTNAPQKYVGIVRNNSKFIVQDVEGAVCAYDAQGKLLDVISRKLSGIGILGPGQQREFYVERVYDWEGRVPFTKLETAKTTITFVAAGVTNEKKEAPNN